MTGPLAATRTGVPAGSACSPLHAREQDGGAGLFGADVKQGVVTVVAALLDAALDARLGGASSAAPSPRTLTSSCSGRTSTIAGARRRGA